MRQFNLLIFDDNVPTDSGGVYTYTNQELSQRLGQYDTYSLHAIIDNVVGSTGALNIYPQHSSDGRNWMDKGTNGSGMAGTAIVTSSTLTAGSSVQREGFEDGTQPSFALVRFRISLTTTTSAHLKLYFTARERR